MGRRRFHSDLTEDIMTRPLILITDDEAQILRFLGHALQAAGYNTCTAATGADALRMVASQRPDLMVLDLGLLALEALDLERPARGLLGPRVGGPLLRELLEVGLTGWSDAAREGLPHRHSGGLRPRSLWHSSESA